MELDERNCCSHNILDHDDPRLSLMDTTYDGVNKEGVLQEGLGVLTDTLINRHIQLYPGGVTNGTH